jgi:hypothetical protein
VGVGLLLVEVVLDELFGCLHGFLVFLSLGLDDHLVLDLVIDCCPILLSLLHDVGKYVLFPKSGNMYSGWFSIVDK